MGARVLVAIGLLAIQVFAFNHTPTSFWLLSLCVAYLVATVAAFRWSKPTPSDAYWAPGWTLTLWVDLAVFGLLQTFEQGEFNYTPLFALPVLLASVLGPLLLALGSAAFASLVLLFDAFSSDVLRPDSLPTNYIQSAITGTGLFLVALLANQLGTRLSKEQAQARINRAWADAQSQVNQIIVTGLSEGVLVLDAQGHVWHANPAACAMLGTTHATAPYSLLTRSPGWSALLAWAQSVIQLGQDDDCEFTLPDTTGHGLRVRLRARITHTQMPEAGTSAACVVFMEGLRDVENRVRNEKLAAMGRVSAAVAHEIRNPLSAISQANALLSEEVLNPAQQRLTTMIGQNAQRLRRTVDDILDVAKLPNRPSQPLLPVALDALVAELVADWQRQQAGGLQPHWQPGAPGIQIAFDPEHLRRVLVNLLDNARRHGATEQPRIDVSTDPQARLEVWNPGPPLSPEVAQHLFEPFSSSQSRSSGLGLYLARELCQRHGASLSYRAAYRHGTLGHAFSIQFDRKPS